MAGERKSERSASGAPGKPKASGRARNTARRPGIHMDAEQQARFLIIGAVVAVLVIALGFMAFGYWYSVVRPRNRTVLQVADQTVSYSAMKRRMGYEFFQNVKYQSSNGAQLLPTGAYQALVDELTQTTQAEKLLGVTIDQAEFDTRLRGRIGVSPDADQRTFADALRKELDTTGLSEGEYRRLIRADVISSKIKDKFTSEIPPTLLQAKVEVISNQNRDALVQAAGRIKNGEDFAAVAKEVSQDTDASTTGGTKEYAPQGLVNAAYDAYAFTAPIGQLSEPLDGTTSTGLYYLVRVVDRSDQPVTESQKPNVANKKSTDWLKTTEDDLTANGQIVNKFDQKTQADAYVSVVNDVAPRLIAQEQAKTASALKADSVRKTTIAELTSTPRNAETAVADFQTPAASDVTPVPTADAGGTNPTPPSQPVVPGNNAQ